MPRDGPLIRAPASLPQPQILTIIAHIQAIPTLTVSYVDPALDQQAWGLLAANLH